MVNGSFGRGWYEDDSRPVIRSGAAGDGAGAPVVDFSTPSALPFRLDGDGKPIDTAPTGGAAPTDRADDGEAGR